MAAPKTILFWGRQDGLGVGIQFLIQAQAGWKLIDCEYSDDSVDLIQLIQKEQPDVVILYYGDQCDDPRLPGQILPVAPKIKIITFSLEDNTLEVYLKYLVSVCNIDDLFAAIND